MNYLAPSAWTPSSNPDTTGVSLGGLGYAVQNAAKPYSLTAPTTDALRFELRPGDKWPGDGTAAKERSEICGATTYPTGANIHVEYGFMLEQGPVNHAGWTVIGQFHQTANDGRSPPFEIDLVGEKMAILVNYLTATGAQAWKTVWTDPAPIVRGKPYAMKIDASFDALNGKLTVSRDGVVIVNYAGPMGFANMGSVYWKEGIYRSASDTVIAAQYSGLSITTGAVAAPAPPAPTVDPRDAQIAALTTQNARLTADLATANAKLSAVRAAAA